MLERFYCLRATLDNLWSFLAVNLLYNSAILLTYLLSCVALEPTALKQTGDL